MKLDSKAWIVIGAILLITILLVPSAVYMGAGVQAQDTVDTQTSTPSEPTTSPTQSPTPSPSPSPSPTPAVYELLQMSDKGTKPEQVKRLQEKLIELGFLTGNADGYYGEATFAAVTSFQRVNGLTADGFAGAETQRVLYESEQLLDVNERIFIAQTPTPTLPPATPDEPDATPAQATPSQAAPESGEGEAGGQSGYGFKFGPITGFGLVSALAVGAFMFVGLYMQKFYRGVGLNKYLGFAFTAFPMALILSRLVYVITNAAELPGFLSVFELWKGGYSLPGALAGIWLACVWFARRRKLASDDLKDLMTPGALVFVFIMALAGHMNAQAAGLEVETGFLAKGFFTAKDTLGIARHHVYRWEAIAAFVMLAYTALNFRALFLRGDVFRLFAIVGLGLLTVFEGMKANPGLSLGALSVTQALCLILFGVICVMTFIKAKPLFGKSPVCLISEGLIGFGLILTLVFGLLADGMNAEFVLLAEFVGAACAASGALLSRAKLISAQGAKRKPASRAAR